ncbi:MAG: 2-oxo acid dehydrogenase subunit E2 [Planctomycetes bacterium]|nr:2-oxo acid dehydrogenase subunit E2 [Planctomycetota bacterium]
MAEPVLMPQVGQDIKTARIVDWVKKENQPVKKGEVIAVVESDKAAFEVEAYTAGVLLKILHAEGQEVEVLTPIAYIGQPGEKIEDGGQKTEDGRQTTEGGQQRTQDGGQKTEAAGAGPAIQDRLAVSPSARRLAQEKGVDPATVAGTGPGGRITKEDILAAARSVPARACEEAATVKSEVPGGHSELQTSSDDTVVAFTPMRACIAQRLTRSKQTIPHFYLSMDVDMSEMVTWRRQFNERSQTKVTVTDMIVQAVVKALSQFGRMNAHVEPDRIVLKRAVNIGVAVAVDDGLIVPVVADADKKSLAQISAAVRENAEAARAGRLKPQALGGFTVTNLGMFAVDTFVPVINPPEAAILAVGAVQKKPVVVGDRIVARDLMTMVLACDHRAVDGTYAAQFLGKIKEHLENPDSLEE